MSHDKYKSCIDACYECAMYCDHCSTACLKEEDVKMMARCIELDMYCSEMCRLTAMFMARGELFAKQVCRLCAEICEACAAECSKHDNDHCRECADACKKCAEECRKMAA